MLNCDFEHIKDEEIHSRELPVIPSDFHNMCHLLKRGLSQRQVAFALGVHEGRISQRMKQLRVLLDRNGYNYRGKKFTTSNINYILKNGFYCGVMTYGNKVSKHRYETIVSTKLYNLINK